MTVCVSYISHINDVGIPDGVVVNKTVGYNQVYKYFAAILNVYVNKDSYRIIMKDVAHARHFLCEVVGKLETLSANWIEELWRPGSTQGHANYRLETTLYGLGVGAVRFEKLLDYFITGVYRMRAVCVCVLRED
jgi:hypothetical protein